MTDLASEACCLEKTEKKAQGILSEFKDKSPDSQTVNKHCQLPGTGRLEGGKKASHATCKQRQWRMGVEAEENREKKRATVPDTTYKGAG